MPNVSLQEISLLPLDQRAAHIARLVAGESHDELAPPRPEKSARARSVVRGLAAWARPGRVSLAVKALLAFAAERCFRDAAAPRHAFRGDEGFYGFAPVPDADAALNVYAEGLYFENFPGLASLWSPSWRAIIRPADALRLPAAACADAPVVRLDMDFDRLLDICDAQPAGAGRRPAFRSVLSALYTHGFAHALELRDDAQAHGIQGTQAVVIGVASGGVFTIEAFFARDRAALGRAVAALARHLKGQTFTAIDFRAMSPLIHGLPIELISRDKFVALLREPGGPRAGRWRDEAAQPAMRRRAA
jgi:Leu/Phe-tRNA-protein transferase